jgi:glycine cleavage system pyridoxal-binding protein P
MPKFSTNPKKFVVSCRVTPKEMEVLQGQAEETGLSITMLLRKSLDLLEQNKQQRTQMRA